MTLSLIERLVLVLLLQYLISYIMHWSSSITRSWSFMYISPGRRLHLYLCLCVGTSTPGYETAWLHTCVRRCVCIMNVCVCVVCCSESGPSVSLLSVASSSPWILMCFKPQRSALLPPSASLSPSLHPHPFLRPSFTFQLLSLLSASLARIFPFFPARFSWAFPPPSFSCFLPLSFFFYLI